MIEFLLKTEFTEEDIQLLIKDKIEESNTLEYKRAEALSREPRCKKEISKDVSSFANSEGGVIIYGIEEEDNVASELSFVDGNEFSKEWLSQIIESNIKRKIDGLKIHPIRFNSEMEKTIYVVQIPCDINIPHMASDKKFYRRLQSRSEPMEEYEVRNLYFRATSTKLKILPPQITLSNISKRGDKFLAIILDSLQMAMLVYMKLHHYLIALY